jgi:hypothetical protein
MLCGSLWQQMVGPFGELHELYQIYRHHLFLLMYFLRGDNRGHVSLLGVLEIGRLEPALEY